MIINEHQREYVELDRAFRAFTLLDQTNRRFFNLLYIAISTPPAESAFGSPSRGRHTLIAPTKPSAVMIGWTPT